MTRTSPVPSIPELAAAPELAVLAATLAVLELAEQALFAVHPELADPDRPYWVETPTAPRLAASVLRHAAGLRRAIDRYCREVTAPPRDNPESSSDDIPF